MASYHLSAKIVSRNTGRSAVAAAAYRSRSEMQDQRQGIAFDYSKKKDLVHSEIMLPKNAPERFKDRSTLWNEAESIEIRKDAQLAREIEVALPRELDLEQQKELVHEFVKEEFINKGMIADINIHHHKENPHAHIMLTTRKVDEKGFGRKNREWNKKEHLTTWRRRWAEITNKKLLAAGYDTCVDHRSYKDQGIDLVPQRHMSYSLKLVPKNYLDLAEANKDNIAEYAMRKQLNGEKIINNPEGALRYMTHYNVAFREADIDEFLNQHTFGVEQYLNAKNNIINSPELVSLGFDDEGKKIFTTHTMIENERNMLDQAEYMDFLMEHQVSTEKVQQTLANFTLNDEQKNAFRHAIDSGDISIIMGRAGTGKSYTLRAVREAYEAEGYRVRGIALSGIAAENLENSSGIPSTTIYSQLNQWDKGQDPLTKNDIIVIDEIGFVGTRQMTEIINYAHKSGAKLIGTGDNEQLPSIEAGGAARGIMDRVGYVELNQVMRQNTPWQAEATRLLSSRESKDVRAGIEKYFENGKIFDESKTRDDAKKALIDDWKEYTSANQDKTVVILTYSNRDIGQLNDMAREEAKTAKRLGNNEITVNTKKGVKTFAPGDRVMFLERNKALDVKNGSLGTVLQVDDKSPAQTVLVKLDNGKEVAFDPKQYNNIDYGYAMTVHKAQGVTVDRSFVLATKRFDKHVTYVALSRHRDDVTVYHGKWDFKDKEAFIQAAGKRNVKALTRDFAYRRGYEMTEPREPEKAVINNKEYQIVPKEIETPIKGMYAGDIEHGGQKYHRIETPGKGERYLVPATEKSVDKNLLLRRVEYDGKTVMKVSVMAKHIGLENYRGR